MPALTDVVLDFENGLDTNGGTSLADAIKTFSATRLSSLPSENIRLLLRIQDVMRPSSLAAINSFGLLSLSSKRNLIVQPYSGSSVNIFPDVVLSTGLSWTNVSGNRWQASVGTGLRIGGITYGYHENTTTGPDGQPMNYGVLSKQTSGANVASNSWSWYYDSAGGTLDINLAGLDPNGLSGLRAMYGGSSYNLLTFINCDSAIVQGINIKCFETHASGGGYGIIFQSASNCVVQDCAIATAGYHPFGYVGNTNENNVFRNCIAKDHGNVASGGTGFINYSDLNGVRGSLVEKCRAVVTTSLNPAGSVNIVPSSGDITGFFAHCSTGVKVSDIEYRDCSAYVGNNAVFKAVGGTDFVDYSGAWNETSGRPARYIRLLTENDTYMSLNMAALFDSCTLRFARAGSTGTSGNGCIRISKFGSGFKVNPLFLRTSITSNLDKSPSGSGVLINAATYDSTDGCSFVDTSWIDTGTTANDTYLFNFNGRTCTVNASRSVFGYSAKPASQSYLCGGDNSLAASYHNFSGCVYVGIRTTSFGWSSNTALDASSEWLSAVDTTGQAMTAANASFANLPNDATVTPGSTLWGNRGYGIGFRRPQLLRQRRGR